MTRRRKVSDEQILGATRKLLLERGLQVTTRMIAAESGISEGILFQRFGSKNSLIQIALSLPPVDANQLVAEASSGQNAREVLENIAVTIFQVFRQVIPFYVPYIPQQDFATVWNSRNSPFTKFMTALERHLIEQRHEGRIWIDSPHRTSYLIVSILHHAALVETISGPSAEINEGTIRDLMETIWIGLEPRNKK